MITFFDYITYSQDEELICRTNQKGLCIYDAKNFELLMKLDPFRIGLSGDVTKAKLFYNSRIIAFSIIETKASQSKEEEILYNDSKIKAHSLVIYDLENYEIIGKITMKNFVEISDFFITKYFIIISIENKNKVLLFKTANLEYYKTITNAELGKITYTDDFMHNYKSKKDKKKKEEEEVKTKNNKCILAYLDGNDKTNIVYIDCLFNEDGTKIIETKTRNKKIEFNSPEIKYFKFVGPYLLVSSSYGNKVHFYEAVTGDFKYCLFLGNFPYEISGLHLDNKEKIISIVTNNKYLKLYKLKKLNDRCKCSSHNDEKISKNEERGMFDKFKHKLGVGRNVFLCRYKVNIKRFDMKDNSTLVFFDKNVNDVVFIIQSNKVIKRLKFDRKKNKEMTVLQEAKLPKYWVNKNDMRTMSLIIEEEKNEENNENKDDKHPHQQGQHPSENDHVLDDDDIEDEKIDEN